MSFAYAVRIPTNRRFTVVEAWRIRAILEATSRRMECNADNLHELSAALADALDGLKAASFGE